MRTCLVGIVKNEGAGIFEWVLYHHLLGFDRIVVYENSSADDTRDELKRAADLAPLTIINWPIRPGQIQAYNHAIQTLGDQFDTFMMLDADEFLLPIKHRGVGEFFKSLAAYPHVGIHWMMYGSNGHLTRPAGLVLDRYTRRAKAANLHIKSIVRPSLFTSPDSSFLNPHWMDKSEYVAADGSPMTWQARTNGAGGKAEFLAGSEIAVINHYYTKSREDYDVKLARANADSLSPRKDAFEQNDKNIIKDTTVLTLYPDIIERIRVLR